MIKNPGGFCRRTRNFFVHPSTSNVQCKGFFLAKCFSFCPTLARGIRFLIWHLLISPLLRLLILLFPLQLLLLAETDSRWLRRTPSIAFFQRGDVVFAVFRPGCWLLAQIREIYAVSWGQPEFSLRRRWEEQLEVGKTVTNVQALPNQCHELCS